MSRTASTNEKIDWALSNSPGIDTDSSAGESGAFTEPELSYLRGQCRLGRVATVGQDGTPHVVPVGFSYNVDQDAIDVRGHELERTKKFRDARQSGRAAIVIDDLASTDPWRPRGIEVRGRAEALTEPEVVIRVHPERVISSGLVGEHDARTVGR